MENIKNAVKELLKIIDDFVIYFVSWWFDVLEDNY